MPDQPYLPIEFHPTGGVNSEDNEANIDPSQVQDARNFLFERGEADTRPALNSIAITGMSGLTIQYAYSLQVAGVFYTLFITTTARLFYVTAGGASATEVTGSGFTGLGTNHFKPISVNGVVMFSVVNSGSMSLLHWAAALGNTYTLVFTGLSTNVNVTMTSQLSRALLALQQPTSSSSVSYVYWSKPGDETTWNTSPSTDGSGNAALNEIPDTAVEMGVLHNVVMVLRSSGITLGYSTGVAIPAFRWETWTREQVGGVPATFAADANIAYFVGPDDVYTFDLSNLTSIGYPIRSKLLAKGSIYVGFISRMLSSGIPRAKFHLMPSFGSAANTPHYAYDIQEQKWSIHSYNHTINYGFDYKRGNGASSPAFVDSSSTPKIWYWDSTNGPCEQASYFVSKSFRTEYTMEMRVDRTLVSYRDQGTTPNVQTEVNGRIGGINAETVTDTKAVGNNNDQYWNRIYFNTRAAVGQDIQVIVSVPANEQFQCDTVSIQLAQEGNLRA